MAVYALLMRMAPLFAPNRRKDFHNNPLEVLLTGTFYSDNWIIPHLRPMSASKYCRRVRMVASDRVPPMDKVEAVYAPAWLTRIIGKIPARLVLFVWIAFRDRPHVVGGFHMLPNGLVAALMGRFISAKSLYICGGGPREIVGGGYASGNRIFGKLTKPDPVIEQRLLDALSAIDITITMGSGAIKYFQQNHATTEYHIVPGGFNGRRFYPSDQPADNDLILIGHLTSIKRVDRFLQAVKITSSTMPEIKAIVVGDGPDRPSLERMAAELVIQQNVRFVGHQNNVEEWLRRSRILVLTSDSEGLAQVLIQGMMCGLPAVVSDVGDLGDLVSSGVNGYLVNELTPEAFAECFLLIHHDPKRLNEFGRTAHQTAMRYEMENVIRQWDAIFQNLHGMQGRSE